MDKGKAEKIEAGDINISDLGNVSLLVLKTKDEKYDADIKYKVNIDGDTEADEAKLNSTKILWLSLDNKKPLPLVKGYKQIKNLELWLEDYQPVEQAVVEIMVLRRLPQPENKKDKGKTPMNISKSLSTVQ